MAVRKPRSSAEASSFTGTEKSRGNLPNFDEMSRAVVEQSASGVFVRGGNGLFVEVNQAFVDLLGYTSDELLSLNLYDLCSSQDDISNIQLLEEKLTRPSPHGNTEVKLRTRDSRSLQCLVSLTARRNPKGAVISTLGVVHDTTELRHLESQLLQAQKMGALARLCGGIAHDFNNLLGGIMGYASLLRNKLEPGSENYEFAQIIEEATHRGAELTQQMLVAAGKGPFRLDPVDVNGVVHEVESTLSTLAPDSIVVSTRLASDLPIMQGEHGQLRQLLLNLCLNAADSMPDGGEMVLSSRKVCLTDDFRRSHFLDQPGPYIELSVADSGLGIYQEDQASIFEPFYTTKEPRRGTGLGLAIVYALVKNHWGTIQVDSSPGQGSTFRVYLPVNHPMAK